MGRRGLFLVIGSSMFAVGLARALHADWYASILMSIGLMSMGIPILNVLED